MKLGTVSQFSRAESAAAPWFAYKGRPAAKPKAPPPAPKGAPEAPPEAPKPPEPGKDSGAH